MSSLSSQQEQQLKELIATDNIISAIRLYRELTGVGLKEAKDAIEAIERGEPVNSTTPSQSSGLGHTLEYQIKRLLADRNKIEAIRLYREAHNCGLKDAKDAVDLIEVEVRKYSSIPAISDDPFADEKIGMRRRFIIFIVVFLLIAFIAIVFFKKGGF